MLKGKTILLVEDNPSVLLLMERALAPEGYTLLSAPNGEAALRIASEETGRIDLLVADLVLPLIGGLELAWRMTERDPLLSVILISGYAGEEAATSSLLSDRVVFLEKPFSAASFRAKVREMLGEPGWAPRAE